MRGMFWMIVVLATQVLGSTPSGDGQKALSMPKIDSDVAQKHELKPHRRIVPTEGVNQGFNQIHLNLTVSVTGDVVKAEADGGDDVMKFWPQLQGEVAQWKFTPFEVNEMPVEAQVEEYLDLVPPERLPEKHVLPPPLKPESKIAITLRRSGCFGSCPAYTVTIRNKEIEFEGDGFTVANGKHVAGVDADAVRKLAKQFVSADFYSMDPMYSASVTDCPTYVTSIDVDGQKHEVMDYMGHWVGMPAVVRDLEEEVDAIANTSRWVSGDEGLVRSLREEKYPFEGYEAQVMLKEAAERGQVGTVRELLDAGVPLKPFAAPKPKKEYEGVAFEHVGWLQAASNQPEVLDALIKAGASKEDQSDKNLALLGAAESGYVGAVRALIAYGANPNFDPGKQLLTKESGGVILQSKGSGSVLIEAARSGNPEMLREVLRYHPKLEAREREGKTAMFAAGEYRSSDVDGARVECVRLLAQAGADVNARDEDGETPLHETFLTDVEEELLRLGADVNARDKDGETPIFTTVDDSAIPLFLEHGADLTIRNKKGETVFEAAKSHGPRREQILTESVLLQKLRSAH